MAFFALFVLALETTPGEPVLGSAAPPPTTLWAGHIVVRGARVMPFFGNMEPRNDTFVLAEVTETADGLSIVQRPCRTAVAPIAGAKISFLPGADERLPTTEIRFQRVDGQLVAAAWENGWGEEDLDGDGNPGVTVIVDAPMCGGTLHVASHTRSLASAIEEGVALSGALQVTVDQRILGAKGGCLNLVAQDSTDSMNGTFAYVPVPAGTTCQDLLPSWPVDAG